MFIFLIPHSQSLSPSEASAYAMPHCDLEVPQDAGEHSSPEGHGGYHHTPQTSLSAR